MSAKVDLITLSDGHKVPVLGLGTWQGGDVPEAVYNAVKIAIDAGYRHFDCASVYGNEAEIGKALKEKIDKGDVKREDLYVVTKLWNDEHQQKLVVPACKRSLKKLGLNYIDLYLVHWPFSYPDEVDYLETWRGMEECVKLGLARSIGVSNFNSQQLTRLLEHASIKPVMNQIEVHINLNQRKLREFCASKSIAITAYSPFGAPGRCTGFQPAGPDIDLNSPVVAEIAKKYGKTCAQVALRYLMKAASSYLRWRLLDDTVPVVRYQPNYEMVPYETIFIEIFTTGAYQEKIDLGTIPIPKSSSAERLKQNIDVFDFKLTPEEIATIDKLDRGYRTCTAIEYKNCKEYPFNIEF